jgi:hypothetical protein
MSSLTPRVTVLAVVVAACASAAAITAADLTALPASPIASSGAHVNDHSVAALPARRHPCRAAS